MFLNLSGFEELILYQYLLKNYIKIKNNGGK